MWRKIEVGYGDLFAFSVTILKQIGAKIPEEDGVEVYVVGRPVNTQQSVHRPGQRSQPAIQPTDAVCSSDRSLSSVSNSLRSRSSCDGLGWCRAAISE